MVKKLREFTITFAVQSLVVTGSNKWVRDRKYTSSHFLKRLRLSAMGLLGNSCCTPSPCCCFSAAICSCRSLAPDDNNVPPDISVHNIECVVPRDVRHSSPDEHFGDQIGVGEIEQTVPTLRAAELLALFFAQDRVRCECRAQVHEAAVGVSQHYARPLEVRLSMPEKDRSTDWIYLSTVC